MLYTDSETLDLSRITLYNVSTEILFDKNFLDIKYKKLDLSDNFISNFDLNIVPEHCEELDLDNNRLVKLDGKISNVHFNKLSLKYNKLVNINLHDVAINIIDISCNRLINIKLTHVNIQRLVLSNCYLSKIVIEDSMIKHLDISHNEFTSTSNIVMDDKTIIKCLNISNNNLLNVEKLSDTIVSLDISNNRVSKIEYLPSNLTTLYMQSTNMSSFDKLLLNGRKLDLLDIRDNINLSSDPEKYEEISTNVMLDKDTIVIEAESSAESASDCDTDRDSPPTVEELSAMHDHHVKFQKSVSNPFERTQMEKMTYMANIAKMFDKQHGSMSSHYSMMKESCPPPPAMKRHPKTKIDMFYNIKI